MNRPIAMDPQTRSVIDRIAAQESAPLSALSPAEGRQLHAERIRWVQGQPAAPALMRDLELPGPSGNLRARLYLPRGHDKAALPLIVYFHGGGWTVGSIDTHDGTTRRLCIGSGCAVLSVDYRLAPEWPFPAAPDDCLAAVRWARDHAAQLGADASRYALAGDSAGANLAAVTVLTLRDRGEHMPALQMLVYPAVDLRCRTESFRYNGEGYHLTTNRIRHAISAYTPDERMREDWRASPLLAADLSRQPETLIVTAGFDPFLDDGRMYAHALSAAGVSVRYTCFERQVHGFLGMGGVIDEATTALDLLCGAARRVLVDAV